MCVLYNLYGVTLIRSSFLSLLGSPEYYLDDLIDQLQGGDVDRARIFLYFCGLREDQ